jgi:adenylate cyclase
MLNRCFTRMSALIVEHGGLVNKFGGDSILAVFGTPLNPDADHAVRAVRAALAMARELAEFNREQARVYLPAIMIGIGIATGDVVADVRGRVKKVRAFSVTEPAPNPAAAPDPA